MKKTILLTKLVLFSFVISGYSQETKPKTKGPEIRAKIEEILSNAEKAKDNPVKLDDALDMIGVTQKDYINKGGDISPETHEHILRASSKIINFMAENKSPDGNHPDLKAKIEKLITNAENSVNDADQLYQAVKELEEKLNRFYYASPEIKRDVAIRLIKIFNSINEEGSNAGTKRRIIETIGRSDNSPEAHEFFLKILGSNNPTYRQRALWSLNSYSGLHGDDIYDKIKELETKAILSKVDTLMSLASANKERALPEILEFLQTTKDLKDFVIVGLNLSIWYKDSHVMDIVIDRYDEFKKMPVPKEYYRYHPADAFGGKEIYKYIEVTESERLKKALEIVEYHGTFGNSDLPIFENKLLKNKNADTRETVVDFLADPKNQHSVSKARLKSVFEEALKKETDKKLNLKLKEIIKTLEEEMRGIKK